MNKLILVNLKMYQSTKEEVDNYLNNLKESPVIFFPSVIYLEKFINHGFVCGCQNISINDPGAYTSEISAKSIKDMGAKYVLLGHSEIRQNLSETDESINLKIKKALDNNLKPILCIGENYEEYTQMMTKIIIKRQIEKALKDITEEVIISYEPVWAIGTGKTPTNNEIEDIVNYIKSLFNYDVKVLYGGSVSKENINELNKIKNVDGFLIGKAGLDTSSLEKIIEVVSK